MPRLAAKLKGVELTHDPWEALYTAIAVWGGLRLLGSVAAAVARGARRPPAPEPEPAPEPAPAPVAVVSQPLPTPATPPPKTVYLVRHGESTFNAAYAKSGGAGDPMLFDAPLSTMGDAQVRALNAAVKEGAKLSSPQPELVLCSPLTRALQTALGAFAGTRASLAVCADLREHLTESCDVGRPVSALVPEFPEVDFTGLADVWWYCDPDAQPPLKTAEDCAKHFKEKGYREPPSLLTARVEAVVEMLKARPERCIALVGHADFFNELALRLDPDREELWLKNCGVAKFHLIG